MSEQDEQQDILKRLEGAVSDWHAQVSQAQAGLAGHLDRAKERFDAAVRNLQQETSLAEEAQTLRAEVEALERQNTALRDENAALQAKAAQLGTKIEGFEVVRHEDQNQHRQAVEALTEKVTSLETALAQARTGMEGAALDTAAPEAAGDSLSERLSRALSDREEAHQEIVLLRAEVESLRRKSSGAADSLKDMGVPDAIVSVTWDEQGHKRRIGEILVSAGIVTEEQLRAALVEQDSSRRQRLGEILVERGYTAEVTIAQVLASQTQVPYVRLEESGVERAATRLVSERLATHHACIPIRVTGEELTLAMSNPLDLIAIEDVELASNRRVIPVVATASEIHASIARHYRRV